MAETKKPPKARAPRASASKPTAPAALAYASKYTVGDEILHAMFGHGTVTMIDTNKLTIEFAGVTKQIVDDYVKHRNL